MSAGRILLVVFGAILVLIGLGMLIGGGFVLWANAAFGTDDGFLRSNSINLARDSYAIVTEPVELDIRGGWWSPEAATIRIEAESDEDVFVGIAEQDDVDRYLANVSHHEITRLEMHHRGEDIEYRHRPGEDAPAPPGEQDFWLASASGTGVQTLEWEVEDGVFLAVLMNADASQGVDADTRFALRAPWLFGIGVGLAVVGFILLVVGVIMIVFAARRPRGGIG